MSMDTSGTIETATPTLSPEEMVQFLENIWETEPDIQNTIDKQVWKDFIKAVKDSYQQ